MRISDWSSDVCSSDLYGPGAERDLLWRGGPDRRFRDAPLSVSGHYVPVTGDFDGDGCGDVLWYGPGTAPDSIWYGGPTVSSVPVVVDGEGFHPVVGDLDGDSADDVLWHAPGEALDVLWYGGPRRGQVDSRTVVVRDSYAPADRKST